jgi:hypothetical protein
MCVEIVTKADLDALVVRMDADLKKVIKSQQEILERLAELKKAGSDNKSIDSGYMSALEYMKAVGIKRWKFNDLIATCKIRTIKKKRKIYVPVGEVERYFRDPEIQ